MPTSTATPVQRETPEPVKPATASPEAEAAPSPPVERRHRRTRRPPADQPPADGFPIMP